MARLAILAGQGALPQQIAAVHPNALFVHFEGLVVDLPGNEAFATSYERFGEMFAGLHAAGVSEVVFAGGLSRPALNPANFDAKMMELAPGLMAAMQGGDDGLLRAVIAAFEAEGFVVKGAHGVLADLTLAPGPLDPDQSPDAELQGDGARGRLILDTMGALDISQACVVARGLCLGIETAQGTKSMLDYVASTRGKLVTQTGGVMIKRPKPGQDLRVDMPAIGPDTVVQAQAAGLTGIFIQARRVIVLDRAETRARAQEAGLVIWASAD